MDSCNKYIIMASESTHWQTLLLKLKSHAQDHRGDGRLKRMQIELGFHEKSLENWYYKTTIPNYNNAKSIELYLENPLPDNKPKKITKPKTEKITINSDGQRSNESYYQFIKRTDQLI